MISSLGAPTRRRSLAVRSAERRSEAFVFAYFDFLTIMGWILAQ